MAKVMQKASWLSVGFDLDLDDLGSTQPLCLQTLVFFQTIMSHYQVVVPHSGNACTGSSPHFQPVL